MSIVYFQNIKGGYGKDFIIYLSKGDRRVGEVPDKGSSGSPSPAYSYSRRYDKKDVSIHDGHSLNSACWTEMLMQGRRMNNRQQKCSVLLFVKLQTIADWLFPSCSSFFKIYSFSFIRF